MSMASALPLSITRRSDTALVFMAKWPEPGRAKTRLCPPLTPGEAAALARAFLLDTVSGAGACGFDRLVAYAPAASAGLFRGLLGGEVGLLPADVGGFGDALRLAQASALHAGYRRVALVACDIPHVAPERYFEGFAALAHADVALGPSADGGYYFLASSRPTPHLFHDVAWSTAAVFAQTLQRSAEAGLSVATIAACDDADTVSDLPAVWQEIIHRPQAVHTRHILRTLAADGRLPGIGEAARV